MDMEKFRSLLNRSWREGPRKHRAVLDAQKSLEQARAANKKLQQDGALRSKILAANSIQFWGGTS